ncbi:hypothetical protein K443DRAFT_681723 [Laccaria amethystina LaAM-08-1]|uniref:Uncharacterized protein n=1 Tax=Laccaria amethystina LaAM-08-1 TaxID=1095629 RepID=A0A0C9XM17_9AGAR|nr:hypothetical protein K443DRAFT_681723 [Laccaria amethystina LaAM-08-1]
MSGCSNFYRGQSRFGRSDSAAAALKACLVIYLHLELMNCAPNWVPLQAVTILGPTFPPFWGVTLRKKSKNLKPTETIHFRR